MAFVDRRKHFCAVLLCLIYLGYTKGNKVGVKKDKHCVHIVSINAPSDDPAKFISNYAFKANLKKALLAKKPGLFRIKDRGFLGIDGTVAIESAKRPGYYLRQKNYKFHLQKASNNSIFAKDATFYLLKVHKDPPLYAFELYGHPSWFIMHKANKKNKNIALTLGHVKGSEREVMDSTFSLKKVRCHQTQEGRVQKKTVVVGNGALVEDRADDDDLNDIRYVEEYDKKGSPNMVPLVQASIKQEPGNVAQKEQDIILEVEQASNASNSKKNTEILDSMEKEIEVKVNDLASSLYNEHDLSKNKVTQGVDPNIKDTDVVIDDSDQVTYSIDNGKQAPEDVVIKTEGGSEGGSETIHPVSQENLDMATVTTDSYDTEAQTNKPAVVSDSPKLDNEHYEIIARASLGIPEGYKEKMHNTVWRPNNEAPYKHNTKKNQNEHFQTKAKKDMKQLFGNLGKSVHLSSVERTSNSSAMSNESNFYSGVQRNNSWNFMENKTQIPFQHKLQSNPNRTLNADRRPVIYFSEKCQNILPNVCEVWAQKRYCLTFNELMKRYCRKACGLCDPIVTTGFSPCDKSCGGGIRLRMIKVNNRQVLQRRACNTHNCPVDGGYTPFSSFSECSATCGKGLRYKHRTCTQPAPQYGGRDCSRLGSPIKTVECHVVRCKDDDKKVSKQSHSHNQDDYKKVSKESHSHNQAHNAYEHMPEYQMEKLSKGYTVDIGTLDNMSGHTYKYFDRHGEHKLNAQLRGRHSKSLHDHYLYHKGQQDRQRDILIRYYDESGMVSKGTRYSSLIEEAAKETSLSTEQAKYNEVEPNSPLTKSSLEKENTESGEENPYNIYEGGKTIYDKYGIPSGSTEEIVKSPDSPYKIILHKNKNGQLVVSEECVESDSSVNPFDDENKSFQKPSQGFYGSNDAEHSQSYGTSNLVAQGALGSEVTQAMGSIGKAIDDDTDAISMSSFMQKEAPKLTLSEELAAENEEALKERQYEENMADKF